MEKKRRELANGAGTVVTYYCSQLEGEQSKHVQKTQKALGWRFGIMQRYRCNGWLHITVPNRIPNDSQQRVRIRITHDHAHPPPPTKPEVRDGRGRFVPGNKSSEEPHSAVVSRPGPTNSAESPAQGVSLGRPATSRTHPTPRPIVEAAEIPLTSSGPSSMYASPEYAEAPLPDPTYPEQVPSSIHTHDSKSPGIVATSRRSPDVMFSRDFLMSIGRDVDAILHKALAGVDNERAGQFQSLFLQLHQLGESIRAEDRAAGIPSTSLQPPPPT
ncbi:hypothetical protein SCHPADRAFT_539233 [Schizopora paradoxa]|uniref:Uncharacterized protein n=1 Tax=Schizopora paradoxa TaxID=27342 RepID=A0A0H2RKL3_9AGAM|nr:hypothetical protein SCHPADRAFT_539233 [Schizopora paradoxa]